MGRNKYDGISRIQRAAMARELRDKGFTRAQIENKLGISQSYLSSLLVDPDGSKDRERKKKYHGTCMDCGGPTTYSKVGSKPCRRCLKCSTQKLIDGRKWTRERILADIRKWNDLYGRPPTSHEWLYYRSPDGDREWPLVAQLQKEFGSWSNAIEAAGFERPPIGGYIRTAEWKAKMTKWPKDLILQRMREWAEEHGRPPMQKEWDHTGDTLPSASTVAKKFGSWNAALEEAGLRVSRRSGRTYALLELLAPMNGNASKVPVPSFESRGEGKSLLDAVEDLKGR